MQKCAAIDGIEGVEIDIFITVEPEKHSHVVFAGSTIKRDDGGLGKYEFIHGDGEAMIGNTLDDVGVRHQGEGR
jgi:hypothetical protein